LDCVAHAALRTRIETARQLAGGADAFRHFDDSMSPNEQLGDSNVNVDLCGCVACCNPRRSYGARQNAMGMASRQETAAQRACPHQPANKALPHAGRNIGRTGYSFGVLCKPPRGWPVTLGTASPGLSSGAAVAGLRRAVFAPKPDEWVSQELQHEGGNAGRLHAPRSR
jgi:hypothetical protein